MKRLNKRQQIALFEAAERLMLAENHIDTSRTFSCIAVGHACGDDVRNRYEKETGAEDLFYGFTNVYSETHGFKTFEHQLARSLAVLMFIESNK